MVSDTSYSNKSAVCMKLALRTISLAIVLTCQSYAFTNSVPVTTNLTFFLSVRTNFIPQSQFQSDEHITYTLAANGTNRVFHRRLPFAQAFDFKLFDANGRELPKTKRGRENSQPAKAPRSRVEISKLRPQSVLYERRRLFRPDEMFVITNRGVYDLQIQIRLCVPMSNGVPDNAGMLNISQFVRSKEFGLVISEPLSLQVIKK